MLKRFPLIALFLGLAGLPTDARAAVCDLTVAGSTCTGGQFGTVIYSNALLPTGTFYIDPFLQLQGNTTEQGYNTSGTTQFDTVSGETRDLLLSEVPTVTIGDTEYLEFLLNINEPTGSGSTLSLDQLQIFLSPNGNVTNYDTATGKLSGLTAIYSLDGGRDNTIKLDYSLAASYGAGAMVVYVPTTLFTQPGGPQYVYIYSKFGTSSNFGAGGGLEEWWIQTASGTPMTRSAVPTPEPGTLLLMGTALSLMWARQRRRIR